MRKFSGSHWKITEYLSMLPSRLNPIVWGLIAGTLAGLAFTLLASLKVTAGLTGQIRTELGSSALLAVIAALVAASLAVALDSLNRKLSRADFIVKAIRLRARMFAALITIFAAALAAAVVLLLISPWPQATESPITPSTPHPTHTGQPRGSPTVKT